MEKKTYQVLLVEDDLRDARLVQEMLSGQYAPQFTIQRADTLLAALNALTRTDFDAALIDLSLPDSQGLATLITIQAHAPGVPIVVLADLESDAVGLAAVKEGAQDFILKNKLTPTNLFRVLRYAVLRHKKAEESGKPEPPKARVIGVLGAKGGVGATTIACHYALELRREGGPTSLAMDLEGSAMGLAFPLRVEPKFGLADAAMNLHRLDAEFWKGVVSSAPSGLHLLAGPGALRCAKSISGERTRHVLRFARALYSHIVIDLGRLNETSLSLLTEIDELHLVTTTDLPALYEASRTLRLLLELGSVKACVRLVLNRIDGHKGIGDLQDVLNYPIFASIHDHSGELADAYINNHFADPALKIRKEIAGVLAKTNGKAPVAPKRNGFRLRRLISA